MTPASACTRAAAALLAALSALHLAWARGSAWPLAGRRELADAVIGRRDVPSPAACLAVAAALGGGAALLAGGGAPRRQGARALVGAFSLRGALGLAGRTDALSPGSTSPRFRELDRRVYSPLCLTLALLALPAALGADG